MIIANAFRKAGIVSEEKFNSIISDTDKREKTKVAKNVRDTTKKSRDTASLDRLESATTVAEFKSVAKQLILQFPCKLPIIQEIIRIAHNFRDDNRKGGKRLVATILQVRDGLEIVRPNKRERYIKRALRKSNPITEVPSDWRK